MNICIESRPKVIRVGNATKEWTFFLLPDHNDLIRIMIRETKERPLLYTKLLPGTTK